MYATAVAWEDVDGYHTLEGPEVTLDRVELAIRRLDGTRSTLVTVYGNAGHLAVGGDASTGVVAYATHDNVRFHQLVATRMAGTAQAEDQQVVAGGQPGRYAARHVLAVSQACEAAIAFARDGTLQQGTAWEPV